MARKVAAQPSQRRREGINRAQLKALAARQAMTSAAVAAGRPAVAEDEEASSPALARAAYGGEALPRTRRRVTLSREEEYAYIRRDLIRLALISVALLVVMLILLFVLR